MTLSVSTVITDYSWNERTRPIISIDEAKFVANVQLGEALYVTPVTFDITASSQEDLVSQFQGLSEVFAKAAEVAAGKLQ